MEFTLELLIGAIGAITGLISLIWHIVKDKPKLIVEKVHFEWKNKTEKGPFHGQWISVQINIRNLSKISTTIENINVVIDNEWLTPERFIPSTINIPGHSSKHLSYFFVFEDEQHKRLFESNKEMDLGIFITHTFGNLDLKRKGSFETGYFSIFNQSSP